MRGVELTGETLSLTQIGQVALGREAIRVGAEAHERIKTSRKVIEEIVANGAVVYGVSTGFGKLSDVHVPAAELSQLQLNLVRSHACGIGQPLSAPEVRAMILLRANVLALGLSGIRLEVIEQLCELNNRGVVPVIPEKGSVGASGDLAPLAHLSLTLIGEGEAFYDGERLLGSDALKKAGLKPVRLEAKEGLALLNGTQAMHAVGGPALFPRKRLLRVADIVGGVEPRTAEGKPAAFCFRLPKGPPPPRP